MRELFDEPAVPSNPQSAAQRASRAALPRRFYQAVGVEDRLEGFAVLLDGRPVKTPARRKLAAPSRVVADALAAEWASQAEIIDPATMPLTRLANSILDGVSDRQKEVADDIVEYFDSDLLFYRADAPERLVQRQAYHWDPILDWARDQLGARFVLAEGVMPVRQSNEAREAAGAAIPSDPWLLGATHSVTTLTGSALLALALLNRVRDQDAIWTAANLDEDWNMETWGRDEIAVARTERRRQEFQAAARVLATAGQS